MFAGTLEKIIKLLGEHTSLQEAIEDWNKKNPTSVISSRYALRRMFVKSGLENPSSYLGASKPANTEESQDDEDDDEDYEEQPSLHHPDTNVFYQKDDTVLIYTPKRLFQISKEMYEGMCFDYSNMSPGGALNIPQICKKWRLSQKDFEAIRKASNWVHANDPYTEHAHINSDTKSLVEDLLQRKRSQFEISYRKKEEKELTADAQNFRKMRLILGNDLTPENLSKKMKDFFTLRNFCDNYENLEVTSSVTRKFTDEGKVGLIIPISDVHAGKKFKSQNPNFVSVDKKVLLERKEKIKDYISREKHWEYDFVNYVSLGDDFESLFGNMRNGQLLSMDMHTLEQYKFVLDFHIDILKTVAETFPELPITVSFQGGNHDRLFESKEWGSENFVVAILVDRIMKEFEDRDNMDFIVGSPMLSQKLPNNINLITQHGHNSTVLTDQAINSVVMIHGDRTCTRHILIQGHFHRFLFKTGTNCHYMINGSIFGNDHYNTEKLNLTAYPEFTMIRVSEGSDRIIGPYNLEVDVEL